MKAIIMAGGKGTRLRPLTSEQPKPMVRIANVPCMEHIIRLLKRYGVSEIVVTLQFMPEEIRDYFGDGSEFGVEIRYSVEDEPAGTAGSVKLAEGELNLSPGESFLVISGDALTDVDLGSVFRYHEGRGAAATVILKSVENPLDFGVVIAREDGRISRFMEKPAWGQVFSDTVNIGIYVLDHSVMDYIPGPGAAGEYDFSRQLFPRMLDLGVPLYGYVTTAYWQDIGDLDQYASAQRDVLAGRVSGIRPPGTRLRENVYIERRAQVDDERLVGPVVIGVGTRIDDAASVGSYSVIGSNVVIADGARVERSIIADGTYIGEGVEVSGAVVGRSCYLQARARIQERSSLGDDVIVGEGATVAPDVKVYPHKTIEDGANVSQSLVFETMGLRTVFRGDRVLGKFNVNFTPEFTVRLASAFAKTLEAGATVSVGRDVSSASQVTKHALTAALLASGTNVRDLRSVHAGVVRHDVRRSESAAGVYIRAGSYPDDVEILFFAGDATPISEREAREIERHLAREEFRRAHGEDVGASLYPGESVEKYLDLLKLSFGHEGFPRATIVVDFSNGASGLVAEQVFAGLGIDAVIVPEMGNPDFEERLADVAGIVSSSGAVLGFVVGPTGEDVRVVATDGIPLRPDVMLAILLERMTPASAVIPASLSVEYRRIVESGGGSVFESRAGLVSVSHTSAQRGADIGVLDDGRFVFPDFLPAPDCFATIAKLFSLFGDGSLSGVERRYPQRIGNVVHERIHCPWASRGRVMRQLAAELGGDEPDVVVSDGTKLSATDGWILIYPDPETPVFHIYSEIFDPSTRDSASDAAFSVSHYTGLASSLLRDAAW